MGLILTSGSRLIHDFPDPPAISVGNSGIVVQHIGDGQATAPTSAFDTVDGFLFAAVGRQQISEFDTATLADNNGNTLLLHDVPHNYAPLWANSGTGIYTKANAAGRTGCIVTDSKPSSNDEITVIAINLIGVTQIEDFAFVYDTSGPTNTSGSVTVTGESNILIDVWAGDDENGEQGPAWTGDWTRQQFTSFTNGNHIQMALATRIVGPGTYDSIVTPQTSQGALRFLYGLN